MKKMLMASGEVFMICLSDKFIIGNGEYTVTERFVNAPYIRKLFTVGKFETAKLYITGLGFYRLFVSGKEITRGLLSPYISNPDDLVYYDEYDLSDLLSEGENCIGAILGNGMQNALGGENWNLNVADFVGAPRLAMALVIDGEVFLEADESFKWAPSPILFDDLRYGEYYDARLEAKGWLNAGFDDSAWENCKLVEAPKGERILNTVPPILPIRAIKPVRIFPSRSGAGYIYDFGYNSAGLCELRIKGERGQRVTLRYGEIVNDGELNLLNLYNPGTNRDLAHIDIYYLSGNGEEVWRPSLTYHGFQYVYVEGITEEQATEELLTYYIYSTELEELTEFECSDGVVNALEAMSKNSTLSNFYHIPTDCPHREKNGWTGDAAVSAEHMLLNFECLANMREFLRSVRAAQREDGAFPGIVPTTGWGFAWGNGPAWDHIIAVIPYYAYKYTGSREILEENADAIYKYLTYMKTKETDEGFAYGLGDWCEVGTWTPTTPLVITDTLILYSFCRKAEFIFSVLGMKEREEDAGRTADKIREKFRALYLKDGVRCAYETQTAYTLMIAYGILSEAEEKVAVERLVSLIRENGSKMKVGILGAREIFHVLSRHGYGDLALHMIADGEFPSYGEWVKRGQTALWERFYPTEDDPYEIKRIGGGELTSLNHHMFGDITHWFKERVLGIFVNPDMNNPCDILIKPCGLSDISFARGGYKRSFGSVSLEWKRVDDMMRITVKVMGELRVRYDISGYALISEVDDGDTKTLVLCKKTKA